MTKDQKNKQIEAEERVYLMECADRAMGEAANEIRQLVDSLQLLRTALNAPQVMRNQFNVRFNVTSMLEILVAYGNEIETKLRDNRPYPSFSELVGEGK